MARRRKKSRRRKPAFSILNALEAYVYATILTEGVAGTSPWGFITGSTDLGYTKTVSEGIPGARGTQSLALTGQGEISLGDMMTEPSLALDQMAVNFQSNLLPMAVGAFTTSITFKIGKKLLRRPISNINRNIMVPALGRTIKL